MLNTYSYKETRCAILVFAETKKEAVEYLIRKGFKATMKNVIFLPETKKTYTYSWDGGDLSRRHEAFSFECDADAMKAAREFLYKHNIDMINVFEGEGTDMRHIVSYTK